MVEATRRAVVTLAVLLTVGLGACSDDGASDDGDQVDDAAVAPVDLPPEAELYVDAVTVALASDEGLPIPDDQARCVAARMVQVFRVDRLVAAGIEPDDLPGGTPVYEDLELEEDEGLKLMDAFQQCDFDFYGALIDSMVRTSPDRGQDRRCAEAAVSREEVRQLWAQAFIAPEDEASLQAIVAMFDVMSACFVGDVEVDLGG